MLRGEKVKLRAVSHGDLPRLLDFYNDVEVELAGGGDPPRPTTLERLQRDFDREAAEPPRDKTDFAIEADGNLIGHCGLFNIDETARHCELGISCGFVEEGRMREHIWLDGRYLDNVLMGILRDEWRR